MDNGKEASCKVRGPRGGFSMLEISIVMAIIGLLAGGIMVTRALVKSATLSSVGTDFIRYAGAMKNFEERYDYEPGDFPTATAIWGTATACPGDSTTPSTTSATCNGDGDGEVYPSTNSSEQFRAWQQMANAGMITGTWPGVSGPAAANHFYAGFNSPKSRYGADHGYRIYWIGPVAVGNATYFEGEYRNTIGLLRGYVTGSNSAAVRPDDSQVIDKKFDDGVPAYGVIRPQRNNANCTVSSAVTTDYNVTYDGNACTVFYIGV